MIPQQLAAAALGRRRAGQLRFGFVAVLVRQIVQLCTEKLQGFFNGDSKYSAENDSRLLAKLLGS
jgi:hypothetical protein